MARISPLLGSRATALPGFPAMASSMACWSFMSRVRLTLGPSTGGWRSASATSTPRLLTTTRRRPSLPMRRRLCSASTPAWPTVTPASIPA